MVSSIRTAVLAVGSATGATFATLYTVPAGYHVRLSELTLEVSANDTITVSSRAASGAPTLRFLADPAMVPNVPQVLSTNRVLEQGDLVLVTALATTTTLTWWLSGTLYQN